MPIYVYKCEACKEVREVLQPRGTNELKCLCGASMSKQPTCQALVITNGTPSFRKQHLGTAPYTTRTAPLKPAKTRSTDPMAIIEGEKWLASLA